MATIKHIPKFLCRFSYPHTWGESEKSNSPGSPNWYKPRNGTWCRGTQNSVQKWTGDQCVSIFLLRAFVIPTPQTLEALESTIIKEKVYYVAYFTWSTYTLQIFSFFNLAKGISDIFSTQTYFSRVSTSVWGREKSLTFVSYQNWSVITIRKPWFRRKLLQKHQITSIFPGSHRLLSQEENGDGPQPAGVLPLQV